MWSCQESNLDLELRKLLYYPLYYTTGTGANVMEYFYKHQFVVGYLLKKLPRNPRKLKILVYCIHISSLYE